MIEKFGDNVIIGEDLTTTPNALLVEPGSLRKVCKELISNEQCYFDSLSCLTGIDNGADANTLEVAYNLYSIPLEHALTLKVEISRSDPKVDSICDIWRTANWHERETYDLLGIKFIGHPDLRRLLMTADWEGHPLRKDYVEPEMYRGMRTEREEKEQSN